MVQNISLSNIIKDYTTYTVLQQPAFKPRIDLHLTMMERNQPPAYTFSIYCAKEVYYFNVLYIHYNESINSTFIGSTFYLTTEQVITEKVITEQVIIEKVITEQVITEKVITEEIIAKAITEQVITNYRVVNYRVGDYRVGNYRVHK